MDKAVTARCFAKVEYQPGFENEFSTEAVKGALPIGRNSPQVCPYNLYAEQISGTSFTQARRNNFRCWYYRMQPSATHNPFKPSDPKKFRFIDNEFDDKKSYVINPNQHRWFPIPLPTEEESLTWIEGLVAHVGTGSPLNKSGICIYQYRCNKSMDHQAFYSSDGEFLVVPQVGTLYIITENGKLIVPPKSVAVLPRGIKFAIQVTEGCRGYAVEVFDGRFQLPDLGPIGSNGLANRRDFEAPVAFFEERAGEYTIYNKFGGEMFECTMDHSPFDVVAWHGNYTPYRYNLEHFNTIGSISFDHPDPSIFTVLTCPTTQPGTALCDFVIFPERWMVQENTFRPPYYHRNTMNEYMGNIYGHYDAKASGFTPGCASLHLTMTPHGPDSDGYEKGSTMELVPQKYTGTMAFMFESAYIFKVSTKSQDLIKRDEDYYKVGGCDLVLEKTHQQLQEP